MILHGYAQSETSVLNYDAYLDKHMHKIMHSQIIVLVQNAPKPSYHPQFFFSLLNL